MLLRTLASHAGGLLLAPHTPFVDEPWAEPLVPVLDDHVGIEHVFRASTPHLTQSDSRTRGALEQIHRMLERFPDA
jgi:hypothetical protein